MPEEVGSLFAEKQRPPNFKVVIFYGVVYPCDDPLPIIELKVGHFQ